VPSNPDGADFHQRPGELPRLRNRFNKSIVNLLVLRGVDVHKSDLTSFSDSRLHVNWVPSSCANTVYGAIQDHLTIIKSLQHCLATARLLWHP